jgi:hypothetical protein
MVGGKRHSSAALSPGEYRLLNVQEAVWTPWPVGMGAENHASAGFRSPDPPVRNESLYLLRYHGRHYKKCQKSQKMSKNKVPGLIVMRKHGWTHKTCSVSVTFTLFLSEITEREL